MSLSKWLLRLLQPKTEQERCSYREAVSCAKAHADNLNMSVSQLVQQLNNSDRNEARERSR